MKRPRAGLTAHGIRTRIVHHHKPECAGRMRAAQWGSGWYLTGRSVNGDSLGRLKSGVGEHWLVAACNFGDGCKAEARISELDLVDALTATGLLPMRKP